MLSATDKPWLKSYKLGPFKLEQTKEPYEKITVHSLLDSTADNYSRKTACYYLGNEIKYKDLKIFADKLAAALADLGVKKGDKVATILPTCPQFIISDFGILKAGAAHVPCSVLHKADDLIYEIGESGAEIVICLDSSLELVESIKDKTKLKTIIITSLMDYSLEKPELKQIAGTYQFLDLIEKYEPKPPDIEIDPMEDLAILVFTGGATGLPKGVMLTHYNRVVNVTQLSWGFEPLESGIRGKASIAMPISLFHQYGHCMMHFAINWGLKMYLIPDPRDTDMLIQLLTKYRPFLCTCVPTQYTKLISKGVKRTQTVFMSTASALAPETAQKFKKQSGVPITEAYGLTETGGGTHLNLSAFSKMTGFVLAEKLGSIGVPMPDTEVKIIGLGTDEEALPGEEGELYVRGPQIMKGYWPETSRGLVDGWLPTGDVVKMDDEGYFYITDRVKDMANISGYKVYTRLIDDILYEHPAVADAAAIGLPDPERPGSERIKAFIILKEGEKITADDIISHCKEKLPPYAVPKFVEFRKELPLTVTEKLFKRQLREEEIAKNEV
ncbi:MAG: long-chain fatty acid--CoA ligase [Desulfobacteraceae bacterium]|nr:AMP-binding protein [Desulfobacteraceae bacterium]MBC2755404.1 long-chain fatty acid--CoA ligase [Desulfobacteraceae bacterium]